MARTVSSTAGDVTSPPGLPAYLWHLCWAVGQPDEPRHLERAGAPLDRADFKTLADTIRRLSIRP